MYVKLLTGTSKERVKERERIVATAGKLSRFPGKVTELYRVSTDQTKNERFINRVISMGHESITDHDYLVFAIEDVSPIVEQILIEERIASFTIKSRREVDFSNSGYYTPIFRDRNYKEIKNNLVLQKAYNNHMEYLFGQYGKLIELGVKKEDARFALPYSFHSNIIMGIDAHVLKDLIIRFTKGKYSKISELKELGEKLYNIVCSYIPYYRDVIDNTKTTDEDLVKLYLDSIVNDYNYDLLDNVKLISNTQNVDKEIIVASLMRIYAYSHEKAEYYYNQIFKNNESLQKDLMRMVLINGGEEFKQVNFKFNVPISLAVLTHLTRHRTHHLMVPDFTPVRNLSKYIVPPTLNDEARKMYENVFVNNQKMYLKFKKFGICDEDLIYFYLAGNKINVLTNMDGKTLSHIARLRICNKAQWEIRKVTSEMRKLVLDKAPIYGSLLGPDCEVFMECHEGKESCGKVKVLKEALDAR